MTFRHDPTQPCDETCDHARYRMEGPFVGRPNVEIQPAVLLRDTPEAEEQLDRILFDLIVTGKKIRADAIMEALRGSAAALRGES